MKNKIFTILALLLSNYYFSQTYSLTAGASGTTISTCSGTFVDDGGASGDYTEGQDRTITFCSSTPGDAIKVTFSLVDLKLTGSGNCEDVFDVYQGDAAYAAPLIIAGTPDDRLCGTYTGTNLPVFYATSASGCITFHFVDNGNKELAGWAATISCYTPCKNPTAALVNSSIVNICGPNSKTPGSLSVNFDGSNSTVGAYGAGGSTVTVNQYQWTFGDGTSLTTTTSATSHTYPNVAGVYVMKLNVVDNNNDLSSSGCSSTNSTTKIIRVLPAPTFTASTVSPLNIGCGTNATLTGVAKSQTETQNIPSVGGVTVSLPDGSGGSFVSNADFSGLFPTGATMTSGCYPTLWFNMEHSYTGDLTIDLIAPSGETVRVFNRHGVGGMFGPIYMFGSCVDNADDGVPGCGATYSVANSGGQSWTNYGAGAITTVNSTACSGYTGTCYGATATLPLYTPTLYNSTNPFTALNGATMNGVWQIKITDNLNLDDGFLFGWGLVFPSSCYTPLESITPSLTTGVWTSGGSGPAVPGAQTTTSISVTDPGPDACPTAGTCTGNQLTNTINFGVFNTPGTYPYLYTATDQFGCTYTNTVNVAVSCACPSLTALSYNGPFCKSITSAITPTVSGSGAISVGSYSATPSGLSIDGSTGAITPSSSTANTYTVTYLVTPSSGTCAAISVNTVVTINQTPTVTSTISNSVICLGNSITLTASGASTYTWSSGVANGVSFSPSATGSYTVTGTSASGCTNTAVQSVTVNPIPTLTTSVTNPVICSGNSTTLTASGASTYTWTGGVTNGASFSPTVSASYTVTGTSVDGCTTTAVESVIVDPKPTVTASVTNSVICLGNSTTLTGSGASTYTWTGGVTDGAAFSPTATASYTVIGTSVDGCTNTAVRSVTVNPIPTLTVAVTNSVICLGNSTALTASGASTYTWTGGVTNGAVFSPTATASYTVTGTSAAGCTNTAVRSVTVNPIPTLTVAVTNSVICLGNSTALTASGASTYTWTGGVTNGAVFSPTSTVSYTVIGTSAAGCTNTAVRSVTVNPIPTTTASTTGTINCTTPTITLNSTLAGVSYTWTAPTGGSVTATNTQNTSAFAGPGTYTLFVRSAAGCTYSTTTSVTQNTTVPTGVSAGANQTLTCGSNLVTLSGSVTSPTNATASWSGPSVSGSTTSYTTTANGAGTYTLTATNPANGCTASSTVQVSPSAGAPAVSLNPVTNTITCTNTLVTVSVSSTLTTGSYVWSGPGIVSGQGTATITVNQGGAYNFTLTNTTNSCTTANNQIVVQNTTIPTTTASATGSLSCVTLTVGLNSTLANMNYTWTAPAGGSITSSSTQSTTTDAAGDYSLTVLDPNNGCVFSTTVAVIQNTVDPIGYSAGSDQIITCASNSVTLNGVVGTPANAVLSWSGASVCGSVTTLTTDVCAAGIYTLTVTDPINSCVATSTVNVTTNTVLPTLTITATALVLDCNNNSTESVTVTSTPSTDVTYSWNISPSSTSADGSVATFTNANNYVCTVTNTLSTCTSTIEVAVTSNTTVPVITISNTQTLTCIAPTAVISLTTTPTSGLSYTWTGTVVSGQGTDAVTVNAADVYTVTVTNTANGCTNTATAQIDSDTNLPVANINATSTNSVITCQNSTVTLSVSVTPSASYSYTWSPTGGNSASASATSANIYSVVVLNPLTGCSTSAQYTVTANTTPPNVSVTNTVLACGSPSVVIGMPSTLNTSYNWTTSGTGSILAGSTVSTPTVGSAGQYVLTVTDNANGCSNTGTVNVTSTGVTAAFTANPTSGTAPLLVNFTNQSTGASSYSWTFGDITNNTSTLSDPSHTYNNIGNYIVTLVATDASGLCSSTATISIEVLENSMLVVPNVFTPNGDGSNDVFKIKSTGIKDLTVDIFNRWGTKLFTIASVNDSWDGGNSSDGTYFFVLKAVGFDGKEYNEKGFISLFR